jgi:ABC-type transporter Mla subunit MlaD
MSPAGRDLDTLNNQLDQTNHFLAKLEARQAEVEAIAADGQNLVSEGHAPDAQGLREQLESLRKQTSRLEDRGKNRLDELEKTLVRVESFYDLYSNIMQHIGEVSFHFLYVLIRCHHIVLFPCFSGFERRTGFQTHRW